MRNMLASRGVAIFIIPIVFSFVYGGTVLGTALQGTERSAMSSQSELEILDLQGIYSSSEKVTARISTNDPALNCGDLYITIYEISGQKKAVKQGAFFDQCYEKSGILPLNEQFSEKMDAGQYVLEAQLFDKNGDTFKTASQKFTVR